ncbi:MAG: hypothetical protein ACPLKX_08930 [Dictyoglomaceae bacterium]
MDFVKAMNADGKGMYRRRSLVFLNVLLGAKEDMDDIITAIKKIQENVDEILPRKEAIK